MTAPAQHTPRTRKPALTKAVLDALGTCIVHAEMVTSTDGDETFVGDMAKVARADKWYREMLKHRTAIARAKGGRS